MYFIITYSKQYVVFSGNFKIYNHKFHRMCSNLCEALIFLQLGREIVKQAQHINEYGQHYSFYLVSIFLCIVSRFIGKFHQFYI